MVKKSKMTTVSVRIEDELMKRLDAITNIIPINKSGFIRSCLEKLCNDNQMLIDHHHKVDKYIDFIRNELSKLLTDMIVVKNGSWKEVKESTILILCDELWGTSKIIFDNWSKLLDKYDLKTEITDSSEDGEPRSLLDLGSIALLLVEKAGQVEQPDIQLLISEEDWTDDLEMHRVSLSYACKKAFEKQSPQKIIREYLEKESARKKEGPQRLVIDAKGRFRRSGSLLYLPVDTEEIPKSE